MREHLVHPWVTLGEDAEVGPFVILGQPFRNMGDQERSTVIGDRATLRSHTVIYAGTTIGDDFQTGHGALIRERCTIGSNVSIGSGTVVEFFVVIEDEVRIHSQAFIPEYSHLEQGCWLGPNVVLTNAKYPQSSNVKEELAGPRVCRGAKIGANATLLPGIVVGRDALVGAGSVVTRDVEEGVVVAGNPARTIGSVDSLPYGS